MRESERTINQANEYVRQLEADELELLMLLLEIAEQKARSRHDGGCGCHQCRSRYERIQEEWHDEQHRVNTWTPDQEEAWICELEKQRNLKLSGVDPESDTNA